MNAYSIVKINNSQYRVEVGQELNIPLQDTEDKKLVFKEVLLHSIDGKTNVGQPFIKGLEVTAEILAEVKGEKLQISKFKAKSRYRKTVGFRPKFTKIKILSIN